MQGATRSSLFLRAFITKFYYRYISVLIITVKENLIDKILHKGYITKKGCKPWSRV